jgi:hypothetical protein
MKFEQVINITKAFEEGDCLVVARFAADMFLHVFEKNIVLCLEEFPNMLFDETMARNLVAGAGDIFEDIFSKVFADNELI